MAAIAKGTLFPAVLANEMFNKVKGHSSLAKMAQAEPIPFNGKDVMTFTMDKEVSIVGENGAKPAGDATVAAVQIRPIKFVYQSRVSDEFMYASEEARLNTLRTFADGFAKKVAKGLDIAALHGVDPATGNTVSALSENNFDAVVENEIELGHDSSAADANIDEALALVDDANGIILGKTIRGAIAALNINGARKYPEFAWGATPNEIGGMKADTNVTVEFDEADTRALVGDFDAFKWGFAKEIPLEVIEYGDPDGTGKDLKQYNQVLLRSEAYIGWGILDANAFAKVVAPSE